MLSRICLQSLSIVLFLWQFTLFEVHGCSDNCETCIADTAICEVCVSGYEMYEGMCFKDKATDLIGGYTWEYQEIHELANYLTTMSITEAEWEEMASRSNTWHGVKLPAGFGPEYSFHSNIEPDHSEGCIGFLFSITVDTSSWVDQKVLLLYTADDGADIFINGHAIVSESDETHHLQRWSMKTFAFSIFEPETKIRVYVRNTPGSETSGLDMRLMGTKPGGTNVAVVVVPIVLGSAVIGGGMFYIYRKKRGNSSKTLSNLFKM